MKSICGLAIRFKFLILKFSKPGCACFPYFIENGFYLDHFMDTTAPGQRCGALNVLGFVLLREGKNVRIGKLFWLSNQAMAGGIGHKYSKDSKGLTW